MAQIECRYLPSVRYSVKALARLAFAEDLPEGDITAAAMQLAERRGEARLITRDALPMCGEAWYAQIHEAYLEHNPRADLSVRCLVKDGAMVPAGTTLFHLEGDVASLVGIERILLNFIGRATGIARATAAYVRKVNNDRTRILDTRKTAPGYRYFDKYAVLCGGGYNHRLNLSAQVLIKENHLARFGGVGAAVQHVREVMGPYADMQIEVSSMEQLHEAIEVGCPLVMLDNFTPEMVAAACELERGDVQLEVSGGITLKTLEQYLHPRLDRVSVGALTHSVKNPNLTLLISEEGA